MATPNGHPHFSSWLQYPEYASAYNETSLRRKAETVASQINPHSALSVICRSHTRAEDCES